MNPPIRTLFVAFVVLAVAACSGGGAASPASAARTIQVSMNDQMRFEPASFEVAVGETIRFEVRNDGQIVHEFYVGTADDQVSHEAEMAAGHSTHDHSNSISVDPGQMKPLELTFARAGTLEVGCHVPGHWPAGMRGTITVT
jgi:uncharacterized cupredoxin-like copper-binding protein